MERVIKDELTMGGRCIRCGVLFEERELPLLHLHVDVRVAHFLSVATLRRVTLSLSGLCALHRRGNLVTPRLPPSRRPGRLQRTLTGEQCCALCVNRAASSHLSAFARATSSRSCAFVARASANSIAQASLCRRSSSRSKSFLRFVSSLSFLFLSFALAASSFFSCNCSIVLT